MVIYFGADHGGFALKEKLKAFVKEKGYEVVDVGAAAYDEQDDYPDFAGAVG
ncbi:MAG: RpiB/LacA/LacB family sugar-phosphate isomerase, partial [Candidatus Harrisonbacteria bacterium]|nr:RpiB/LacA/LacB family sugar-phosphate isomerase [Candidatus Harrisonbacteria bacterium]